MTEQSSSDLPPFSAFLATHDGGIANTLATEALAEVVKAVGETGLKGRLTVTVDIERIGDDVHSPQNISIDAVPKIPRRRRGAKVWFPTKQGGLANRDQRQGSLFDEPVTKFDPRKEQASE